MKAFLGALEDAGVALLVDVRARARSGRHDDLREIYLEHLATPGAQAELAVLAELVQSGRRLCLMCFEADPAHCHRSMITDALVALLPVQITNLEHRALRALVLN